MDWGLALQWAFVLALAYFLVRLNVQAMVIFGKLRSEVADMQADRCPYVHVQCSWCGGPMEKDGHHECPD